MTNKLKKEIENYFNGIYTSNRYWVMDNRRISDKKFQDILNCIEKDIFKFLKQAKLSQKQEDDERFEEFIKRLKKELVNPIKYQCGCCCNNESCPLNKKYEIEIKEVKK